MGGRGASGAVDGLAASDMPALVDALGEEQAPAVRRSALAALGRARELVDDEPLLVRVRGARTAAMDAFDVGVRAWAARALVQLRDPAVLRRSAPWWNRNIDAGAASGARVAA